MKVTVYETFENMVQDVKGFVIDSVEAPEESKTGGWAISKKDGSLGFCFPSSMFFKVEA